MRIAIAALLLATLTACSALPEPDAQIRLSELHGAVEGGSGVLVGGDISGDACVLSILGKVPKGIQADLSQGSCRAVINAPSE